MHKKTYQHEAQSKDLTRAAVTTINRFSKKQKQNIIISFPYSWREFFFIFSGKIKA